MTWFASRESAAAFGCSTPSMTSTAVGRISRQVPAALGEIAQTMPVISKVSLLGVRAPEVHEPQSFDKRLGVEPSSGNVGSDRRRA
jgi:hypothetical protein